MNTVQKLNQVNDLVIELKRDHAKLLVLIDGLLDSVLIPARIREEIEIAEIEYAVTAKAVTGNIKILLAEAKAEVSNGNNRKA